MNLLVELVTMAAMMVLSLAFIVLSAAGLVCLTLGLRGRAVFTAPRCAKCKYDLRALNFMGQEIGNCPECGARLDTPGAVSFGKLRKWRGMMIAGGVMLVLPWLSLIVLIPMSRSVAVGPTASASLSNAALLAKLPTTIDQPRDWEELERRLKAGSLSTAEAETAISALTADLNAKRAKGQDHVQLTFSSAFVEAALAMKDLDPEKRQAFWRALDGDGPAISMRSLVRQGEPMSVELTKSGHWELGGATFCWSLKSLVADGTTPLTATDAYYDRTGTQHPDRFSGSRDHWLNEWRIAQRLSPGEHEIVFTFDVGVVSDKTPFRGLEGRPGPLEKWPAQIAHWQGIAKQKIKIVAKGEPVIEVVQDKTLDPIRDAGIAVELAVIRPASQGVELAFKWKHSGAARLPLAYRVEATIGGKKFDAGQFVLGPTENAFSSFSDSVSLYGPVPDAQTVNFKLIPDPKIAERHVGVGKIFGGEAEIRDVPLERYKGAPIRDVPQGASQFPD